MLIRLLSLPMKTDSLKSSKIALSHITGVSLFHMNTEGWLHWWLAFWNATWLVETFRRFGETYYLLPWPTRRHVPDGNLHSHHRTWNLATCWVLFAHFHFVLFVLVKLWLQLNLLRLLQLPSTQHSLSNVRILLQDAALLRHVSVQFWTILRHGIVYENYYTYNGSVVLGLISFSLNICSFVHQCNIHFLLFIIRRHVSASHGHLQVL
jgi:hypothetical protein